MIYAGQYSNLIVVDTLVAASRAEVPINDSSFALNTSVNIIPRFLFCYAERRSDQKSRSKLGKVVPYCKQQRS